MSTRLIIDGARNDLRARKWRRTMQVHLETGLVPVVIIPRRTYPKSRKRNITKVPMWIPLETLRRKRA